MYCTDENGRDAPTARPQDVDGGRFVETSIPARLQDIGRDGSTSRPPFVDGHTLGVPLPNRKRLPHGRPILPESLYFITIHAEARERNVLAVPEIAPRLWNEWEVYHRIGRCFPVLFLVMPDHVHGLFNFPVKESMQSVVSAWKSITARRYGIRWQRDFFDHRVRNDAERVEKDDYIVMNPVRKNLVIEPNEWPYVWRI